MMNRLWALLLHRRAEGGVDTTLEARRHLRGGTRLWMGEEGEEEEEEGGEEGGGGGIQRLSFRFQRRGWG
jgi:hypothetical protein